MPKFIEISKELWDSDSLFKVYGFLSIVSGMVSIWSIMILSLERFWVIYCVSKAKMRLAYVRMLTMKLVMVVMWTMAIILASLPLLGYSKYVYEVNIHLLPSGNFTN